MLVIFILLHAISYVFYWWSDDGTDSIDTDDMDGLDQKFV